MSGNQIDYALAACGPAVAPAGGAENDVTGAELLAPLPACTRPPAGCECSVENEVAQNVPQGTAIPACPIRCDDQDHAMVFPAWASLGSEQAIDQVDQYGAKGFIALRSTALDEWPWDQCSWTDFCAGPVAEGVTPEDVLHRYETRWQVLNDGGRFFYGFADGPLDPAPAELFSADIPDAQGASLAFDADARPCFAFYRLFSRQVEVRRFVAGVPTTYAWEGKSPKLFYNGILQPDPDLRDVVCYYIYSGVLYARFQRDNFGVAYEIADTPLLALVTTDRGTGTDRTTHFLAAVNDADDQVLLRSALYDLWPVLMEDAMGIGPGWVPDGNYIPNVVEVGPADPNAMDLGVAWTADGDYQDVSVTRSSADAKALAFAWAADGDYFPLVITKGPHVNTDSRTVAWTADGDYFLSIIVGGTYTNTKSTALAWTADGDYSLV